MKLPPRELPDNVHSSAEGWRMRKAAIQHKLSHIGVSVIQGTKLGACALTSLGVIALDIHAAGQLGEYYFAPVAGQPNTSTFGSTTVLAGVMLSTLVLHLSAIGKEKSTALKVIDKCAPWLAVAFITGTSLLLQKRKKIFANIASMSLRITRITAMKSINTLSRSLPPLARWSAY
jgi:hypothetical protein